VMCGVSGDSGGDSKLGRDGFVAAAIDILSFIRSCIDGRGSDEEALPLEGVGEKKRSIGRSSSGGEGMKCRCEDKEGEDEEEDEGGEVLRKLCGVRSMIAADCGCRIEGFPTRDRAVARI
jgi:hypothetical protein